MTNQIYQTIESCRECASICKACAAACTTEGKMESYIQVCLDCALICELAVTLGESQSHLFDKAVRLCVDACINCIEMCDKSSQDFCRKCSLQCQKCKNDCLNAIETMELKQRKNQKQPAKI